MRPPLVSVLMPAFNAARYIGRAAGSILAQTMADLELIVVDDGSSDGTRNIVEALADDRVRLIANGRNLGVSASLNIAAGIARGRYIARLDADDIAVPTRLERQVAFLRGTPECCLLASDTWEIEGDRCFVRPAEDLTDPRLLDWALHIGNPIGASTTIFRAEVMQRLGMLADESLAVAEDFDFYHRVRRTGLIFWRPERLVYYRWHGGGLTSQTTKDRLLACTATVLKRGYYPLLGTQGDRLASLVASAIMMREPLVAPSALEELANGLSRLLGAYQKQVPAGPRVEAATKQLTTNALLRVARCSVRRGMSFFEVPNAALPAVGRTFHRASLSAFQLIGQCQKMKRKLIFAAIKQPRQ